MFGQPTRELYLSLAQVFIRPDLSQILLVLVENLASQSNTTLDLFLIDRHVGSKVLEEQLIVGRARWQTQQDNSLN